MSDDFLSEIDEAVSGAPVTNTVTNTPIQTSTPAPTDNKSTKEVEADIYDALGFEDPTPEPKAKTPEPTPEPIPEPKLKDEAAKEEAEETNNPAAEVERKAAEKKKSTDKPSAKPLDQFFKEDAKGNLVTAAGDIIAPAGIGRTTFENIRKEGRAFREQAIAANQQFRQLQEVARELNTRYQDMKTNPTKDVAKHYDLDDQSFKQAITLAKEYQANPLQALKNILTRAAASGIKVNELGTSITADPAALRGVVEDTLRAQAASATPPEPSEEERIEKIQTEIALFYYNNRDAYQHEDKLAKILEAYPQLTLQAAWDQLQLYLAKQEPTEPVTNTVTNPQLTQQQSQERRQANPANPANPTRHAPVQSPQKAEPDLASLSFAQIAEKLKKEIG